MTFRDWDDPAFDPTVPFVRTRSNSLVPFLEDDRPAIAASSWQLLDE
jgi:hypothetical protein